MTAAVGTDRIEKTVELKAPRSRVWRALTTPQEFAAWFGVELEAQPFAPSARIRGRITIPGYQHVVLDMTVEKLEPEHLFSYRWHPYAVEPGVDYSSEPTTLVEFRLEDAAAGTRLTVVESGFERIPLARRAEAFRMNEGGWAAQLENVQRHVAG